MYYIYQEVEERFGHQIFQLIKVLLLNVCATVYDKLLMRIL
jgi:hypothetical protein